jgi:LmbE family N-acetylglucosaminyl deacetylase
MNVLAISPHTDDVELGAGGFIARLTEEGHHVVVVALSKGNDQNGALETEFFNAMNVLQVSDWQVSNLPTREFYNHRQSILDLFVRYSHGGFDLVLMPSRQDVHQDHITVNQEAIRAFRHSSMLGYELSHNIVGSTPEWCFYAALDESHILTKLKALRCYESQSAKPYMHPGLILGTSELHGTHIGKTAAERFEVIRWIF